MAVAELTLVLSGHLRRPQSADLRPFWRGFIELQKKLPADKPVRQIVAHSWNPDLEPLVRAVYAPQAERHEHQACFYAELMRQVDPRDRIEQGVYRLISTWSNFSLQSVIGDAWSRAQATELLSELSSREGQVLITCWDLGQTGGEQVNQLVADASLPGDYLYLAYSSEVDDGYSDIWMLAPWSDARRFSRFYTFVLESLAGRNRYLEQLLVGGWPRARAKTHLDALWSHPVAQRVLAFASKLVRRGQNYASGDALPKRVVRRLAGPVHRFLSRPPVTAENSCLPGFEARSPIFPASQALNIPALLKYFILSDGLRDRVRFLTREDFDITDQPGQLINPQAIALIVHEADDAAMARLYTESPLPLASIYQVGIGAVRQHAPNGQGQWESMTLQAEGIAPRDLMTCALQDVRSRLGGAFPILVMPTVNCYLGCTDWFYMNALVKYLAWSHLGYVGLSCSRSGTPHREFPGLQMVTGAGALSLRMAAGTAAAMRSLLDVTDPDLNEVSDEADRMLLEFAVVANGGGLF